MGRRPWQLTSYRSRPVLVLLPPSEGKRAPARRRPGRPRRARRSRRSPPGARRPLDALVKLASGNRTRALEHLGLSAGLAAEVDARRRAAHGAGRARRRGLHRRPASSTSTSRRSPPRRSPAPASRCSSPPRCGASSRWTTASRPTACRSAPGSRRSPAPGSPPGGARRSRGPARRARRAGRRHALRRLRGGVAAAGARRSSRSRPRPPTAGRSRTWPRPCAARSRGELLRRAGAPPTEPADVAAAAERGDGVGRVELHAPHARRRAPGSSTSSPRRLSDRIRSAGGSSASSRSTSAASS